MTQIKQKSIKINKNIKNFLIYTLKVMSSPLYSILKKKEISLLKNNVNIDHAPIFIVGNPRSGTTLLYQAITHDFKVCYFSNLMCLFPESPIAVARIAAIINGCKPPISFYNNFGKTVGLSSPNQGEYIWKRWFNDCYDIKTIKYGIELKDEIQVRNSIGLLQKYFESPSVNKWQPLSEKIIDLARIFPEGLFVRIKREREFIAQSILYSKRKLWNDDNKWFSTKPRNYKEIKNHNYLIKICEQVESIEKYIDTDIGIIGKDKFLTVHYEDLCISPHKVMNKLHDFYIERYNNEMYKRKSINLPSKFTCGNRIKIDKSEFDFIVNYFKKIQ